MRQTCGICPHSCVLEEGQTGLCGARKNVNHRITDENYGQLTAIALDPIEKKPLMRFFPGSRILSVGSFGCNLRCPFCQNSAISMHGNETVRQSMQPDELVQLAESLKGQGNIGIAYTYNEPLVGYEFVQDCASAARKSGLKNVLVTNGYCNEEPWKELLPVIDAMNIDLKAFNQGFYRMAGGELDVVKRSIELAAGRCHVEVTTLIIPDENDSDTEMGHMAAWLASIGKRIPLHITRFFPRYKMRDRQATPTRDIFRLAEVARRHLEFVYEGNC
ncbi:AmmeMemoRadiSam system radical SAM enzyme [Christensenella intestinihominis]|uniref:AmmeMemoRadiSam system radical SAM enzyme n=1 Tax=Christensenella intestinihominis TaxID=1851429 RepID=UPI00082B68AC|nr:AmmeMemoRadiSam system radical SAM enzyme [Christensenella intestinihominis]